MPEREHLSDLELEETLATLVASAIPAPTRTRELAEAAWSARDLDAELATLSFDSALQTTSTARGPGAARQLTFEAGALSVEIEVSQGRSEVARIEGLLHPAGTAEVALESEDRSVAARTAADQLGRFTISFRDPGLCRLRIDRDGATLVTDWFHM